MSAACVVPAAAGAIRSVLGSVDCNTRDFAQRGYEALTGGRDFQSALTVVLTLYIAAVGWRLLFATDGARLSDGPRMALKVGAVLALVTSWSLFQTLVFDVASKAPAEIAAMISAPSVGGEEGIQDAAGRLQLAYDELSSSAVAFGKAAGPATAANASREAAAARALTTASAAILSVDAGLIAATRLVIGVLTAIGPIFITLILFRQTRGLFTGWVRALLASAFAALAAWTLILLMLRVVDPWLAGLAQDREINRLDVQAAMSAASVVFVFTGAQVGVVIAALVIAMGFRFGVRRPVEAAAAGPAYAPAPAAAELTSRATILAEQLRRFEASFAPRERVAGASAGRGAAAPAGMEPLSAPLAGDVWRRAGPRPGERR